MSVCRSLSSSPSRPQFLAFLSPSRQLSIFLCHTIHYFAAYVAPSSSQSKDLMLASTHDILNLMILLSVQIRRADAKGSVCN